jgi:hypothetical protein
MFYPLSVTKGQNEINAENKPENVYFEWKQCTQIIIESIYY